MAGLVIIKRRIKSVTSTQKITKAMGLVATAKLRKSSLKLAASEKFHNAFSAVMKEVISNHEEASIYLQGNRSKKKLFIVLTSDSGFCGGFNNNVVTAAVEPITGDKENCLFVVVGKKGKVYFNRLKLEPLAEYADIGDLPTLKQAEQIIRYAVDLYKSGEVGEISVAYTRFVSMMKQTITIEKLFPLSYEKEELNSAAQIIKFEPSVEEVLEHSVDLYAKQALFSFMCHAKASEQSARMVAMDSATKNADELLEKLHLLFNRIRQSAITQEISEIVGGAEAQK